MFPHLAGQQADYLEKQLHAFRNKTRLSADAQNFMWPIVKDLTDQEIKLLASYFSSQKRVPSLPQDPTAVSITEELIKKGASLYQTGIPGKGVPACSVCHGSSAEGSARAPVLAGQPKEYIMKQLHAFRSNERTDATVMPGYSKEISPEAAEALGAFLQSLKPTAPQALP